MTKFHLPRFFNLYAIALSITVFFLLLKVPFAFVPPQKELWVVVNFVFDSWKILWDLLRYFCSLGIIYAALVWWAYRLTLRISERLQLKPVVVFALFTLCLIWLLLTLLIANYAFNPISGFDWLVPPHARTSHAGLLAALLWLLFAGCHLCFKAPQKHVYWLFVPVILILPACWFVLGPSSEPLDTRINRMPVRESDSASRVPVTNPPQNKKPNIIIIGVDSLSLQHFIRYGDYIKPLYQELEQAYVFTDTVTAVPRTYPSWASILSGNYSNKTGIRFNLMPRERESPNNRLLPTRLREQGYRTIFGMDERLFANFDESYDFEEVYGPPLGASDMPLSGASDHPIANLIGHVPFLGKWVFPHTYANRAAAKSYYPEEFSALLKNGLDRKDNRPVFLVAHFCLPHWPYFWGERFSIPKFANAGTAQEHSAVALNEAMHAAAVRRAGVQVSEFIDYLKTAGYLENTILVLLSDHGENIIDKQKIKLNSGARRGRELTDLEFRLILDRTNASYNGHGVNVFDEWQTGVMLGFRGFGESLQWIKPGESLYETSLVDVAPTVLDLAGVEYDPKDFDGESLRRYIEDGSTEQPIPSRFRIVESDLLIRAMRDINKIDVAEVVKEGISLYDATSDGRVELKPSVIDEQLPMKVRSVYYGDWILSISAPVFDLGPLYVLLNRKTGEWSEEIRGDLAKTAPVDEMINALQEHYGSEFPDKHPQKSPQ